MRYCYLLSLLGCTLIAIGAAQRNGLVLLAWLGGNFLTLGIAHGFGSDGVLGKRSDGTISASRWLLFLPLLALTTAVWNLVRLLSREPAISPVTDDLFVGRRLQPHELDREFDNYVDLTAEFSEPSSIRQTTAYFCFPILDGAAPSPESLRAAVGRLRLGTTFIHCAQGHGRTGLFALAVLMMRGAARSVDEALRILQAARPGIRLNKQQLNCARDYAEIFMQ
jgi:protein-tyrosine phosphatase